MSWSVEFVLVLMVLVCIGVLTTTADNKLTNASASSTCFTSKRIRSLRSDQIYMHRCSRRTIDRENGIITSPGYPNLYPSNRICYDIIAPPQFTVTLNFTHFDMMEDVICRFDHMLLFTKVGKKWLGDIYCGSKLPPSLTSAPGGKLRIVFIRDYYTEHKGFKASFFRDQAVSTEISTPENVSDATSNSTEQAEPCGGTLSEEKGVITSPNFPNMYPTNINCTWDIVTPRGYVVTLIFNYFDLEKFEQNRECSYDHVKVLTSKYKDSWDLRGTYCGSRLPYNVTAHALRIVFVSDETGQWSGFNASYITARCGGHLEEESGVITSPFFPNFIAGNMDCDWYIKAPPQSTITLNFTDFELSPPNWQGYCTNDYVQLFSHLGDNSWKWRDTYCGSNSPPSLTSEVGGGLELKFRSPYEAYRRGFKAFFFTERVENVSYASSNSTEQPVQCGGTFSEENGVISSPNFPNMYPNNVKCTWDIMVPPHYRITLNFTDFDLEKFNEYEVCTYDYVRLLTKTNGTWYHEDLEWDEENIFCGSILPPSVTSMAEGTLRIVFKSDKTEQSRGFKAAFTRVACGGTLYEENGIITSPNFPDNYNPGMNCTWDIVAPDQFMVTLNFTDFDMEEYRNCSADYVKLLTKVEQKWELRGTYCGSNLPPSLTSEAGGALRLVFHSHKNTRNRGFKAFFFRANAVPTELYTHDESVLHNTSLH